MWTVECSPTSKRADSLDSVWAMFLVTFLVPDPGSCVSDFATCNDGRRYLSNVAWRAKVPRLCAILFFAKSYHGCGRGTQSGRSSGVVVTGGMSPRSGPKTANASVRA